MRVIMKGDKGRSSIPTNIKDIRTDTMSEFSGTLLGFDDFVSK